MHEALCKAMDSFKERELKVIALYYYEKMSMIEISRF
jgi:DNA-directed RNA polymerase specialized sigma subunit